MKNGVVKGGGTLSNWCNSYGIWVQKVVSDLESQTPTSNTYIELNEYKNNYS